MIIPGLPPRSIMADLDNHSFEAVQPERGQQGPVQCPADSKRDTNLPPVLSMALGQLQERERTRFGSFISDDSDGAPVAPPVASRVALRTYSQQLEDYITRFRCRPPDIKFWPYGPYWPRYHDGVKLDTPRFLNTVPAYDEPRAPKLRDEDGRCFSSKYFFERKFLGNRFRAHFGEVEHVVGACVCVRVCVCVCACVLCVCACVVCVCVSHSLPVVKKQKVGLLCIVEAVGIH